MSSLTTGFTVRMGKQAANTQRESTPSSEGPKGKCFKHSGPAEEVQISPAVILLDSP